MIRAPLVLAAAFLAAAPSLAQQDHSAHQPASASARSEALSHGEVTKVDKAGGKVTIKHGPLANLGMPPMTMVFRVADPALLARLEPGAQVRFRAEKLEAGYTVTELRPAK